MVCTWDAGVKVNCNTNYTLHYQKTAGSKKGTCFPHNFRVDPERGGLSAHCICRFAVPGFDSTDEYEVEICSDGRAVLNSTIHAAETIKTAAPHILSVVEDEDKKVTLLWNSSYRTLESLVDEPAPDQSADNATVQQLPNHKSHLTTPVPPAFHTAPVKDSVQLSAPAVMNIYEYQPVESCLARPLPNQNSRLPASVSRLGDGLSVTYSAPLNKEAWEPVNGRLSSPGTVEVIDGYQSYAALAGITQSTFSRAPAAEHRQIENSADQGSSADGPVCCDQAYKSVQSLLEMTARELPFVKTTEQDGNVEDQEVDSFPILDFTASNSCVPECQTIQSTGAKRFQTWSLATQI
ncbi:UNVERIFIED_CONTAM: hypothetical protein FKN15_039542 [Acipenser sinensis]